MSELKWYVVRAVAGQEKKAKSYLETEIMRQKLDTLVPQILIPTEKVYEVRNGKKKVREKTMYAGYMIVQADITNGEVFHTIKSTPGVIGFLSSSEGANKVPVPLRLSEVQRMLGQVDEANQAEEKMESPFVVGETIKVTDGAFAGFSGTIEQVFDDRKKLSVVVKIFGRNTPMELSYVQVEKELI